VTKLKEGDDMKLSTVAHIAYVFGYRLALVPMPLDDTQKKAVSDDTAQDDGL
jgi:hypothetical protein